MTITNLVMSEQMILDKIRQKLYQYISDLTLKKKFGNRVLLRDQNILSSQNIFVFKTNIQSNTFLGIIIKTLKPL